MVITRVAVAAVAVVAAAVGLRRRGIGRRHWAEAFHRRGSSALIWKQRGIAWAGGAPWAGVRRRRERRKDGRPHAAFSSGLKHRACVHRGDVEAAGALDIHEEGVGRLDQPLELVPPLLQLLGRVQQVHVPHRDEAHGGTRRGSRCGRRRAIYIISRRAGAVFSHPRRPLYFFGK